MFCYDNGQEMAMNKINLFLPEVKKRTTETTNRQTDRQKDRKTEKQKDREDREDIQTERQNKN
jgi:hypothetical protein